MTRVAIVGSGFGGLAAAVRLKQAGIEELVLFEKSTDVVALLEEHEVGDAGLQQLHGGGQPAEAGTDDRDPGHGAFLTGYGG